MTNTFRVILVVGLIIYFFIVFRLLKKKLLTLKYSLLWLLMGIVMSILVLFPQLLEVVSKNFGIVDTMNALFTFAIGFILMLLIALTSIVSKQSDRIKSLIQDNALLEKRLRGLEENQNSVQSNK